LQCLRCRPMLSGGSAESCLAHLETVIPTSGDNYVTVVRVAFDGVDAHAVSCRLSVVAVRRAFTFVMRYKL